MVIDLRHLGLGNFTGKHPAHPAPTGMDVQHHLRGFLQVHRKKLHQHIHHKVHRGEVIIEQKHGVQRRSRHTGAGGCHGHTVFVHVLRFIGLIGHPAIIRSPRMDDIAGKRDNSAMQTQPARFWQPDVTVATVVVRDGRLLCVEEHANGALVINQPAGHLEPDENLIEAALRETREETGWQVRVTHVIGFYQWRAPETGKHYLRVAFAAEPLEEILHAVLDDGIVRALWLSPEELQAQSARHRSPLVWKVVTDYLGGSRHPLALVQHLS